jgi:hypothetical protein
MTHTHFNEKWKCNDEPTHTTAKKTKNHTVQASSAMNKNKLGSVQPNGLGNTCQEKKNKATMFFWDGNDSHVIISLS